MSVYNLFMLDWWTCWMCSRFVKIVNSKKTKSSEYIYLLKTSSTKEILYQNQKDFICKCCGIERYEQHVPRKQTWFSLPK